MMIKILMISLSFIAINAFSQVGELIGDDVIVSPFNSNYDMVVTNNGEVFIASIGDSQDYLRVEKFDGSNWLNTVTSGEYLDSAVTSCKFAYNSTKDSLFLGYTKSDGFYIRDFLGAWSTASYEITPTFANSSNDNQLISTIDEQNNIVYFMYLAGPSYEVDLISFSANSSNFIVYDGPLDMASGIGGTDLEFNSNDGFIYFSYSSNTNPVIE